MPKQTDLAKALAELSAEADLLEVQLSERRCTIERLRGISTKPKPAAKRTRTKKEADRAENQ